MVEPCENILGVLICSGEEELEEWVWAEGRGEDLSYDGDVGVTGGAEWHLGRLVGRLA